MISQCVLLKISLGIRNWNILHEPGANSGGVFPRSTTTSTNTFFVSNVWKGSRTHSTLNQISLGNGMENCIPGYWAVICSNCLSFRTFRSSTIDSFSRSWIVGRVFPSATGLWIVPEQNIIANMQLSMRHLDVDKAGDFRRVTSRIL